MLLPSYQVPLMTTAFHTRATGKELGLWPNSINHWEIKAMKERWKNPMFLTELTFLGFKLVCKQLTERNRSPHRSLRVLTQKEKLKACSQKKQRYLRSTS